MANKIFNSSSIKLAALDATCVSNSGLEVSPANTLAVLGWGQRSAIGSLRPDVIQGDVQKSAYGVIQDPAGSAVGIDVDPAKQTGVGGGSAGIYSAFHDLKPIPSIPVGASVFNTTTGRGRRVLHTYSPTLAGSPHHLDACRTALEQLANAYCNALTACNRPPDGVAGTADAALVNLVPIAGAIFAGSFQVAALGHLHPSYTLTAIAIAQLVMTEGGEEVLLTALYYHSPSVYNAASSLVDEIYPKQTSATGN